MITGRSMSYLTINNDLMKAFTLKVLSIFLKNLEIEIRLIDKLK